MMTEDKERPEELLRPVGQTFMSATDSRPLPSPDVSVTRRRLPHWRIEGTTYYVTFRVKEGVLSDAERALVLDHIKAGDKEFYTLVAAQVMADHVHVILTPAAGVSMKRITKGLKGVSARLINQSRGASGSVWLDESYDRIVRNRRELDQKLRYMLNNPAAKQLAEEGWAYRWWYFSEDSVKEL